MDFVISQNWFGDITKLGIYSNTAPHINWLSYKVSRKNYWRSFLRAIIILYFTANNKINIQLMPGIRRAGRGLSVVICKTVVPICSLKSEVCTHLQAHGQLK